MSRCLPQDLNTALGLVVHSPTTARASSLGLGVNVWGLFAQDKCFLKSRQLEHPQIEVLRLARGNGAPFSSGIPVRSCLHSNPMFNGGCLNLRAVGLCCNRLISLSRCISLSRYTYIHTYIHTYIQTYIHTYIHTYADRQTNIHTVTPQETQVLTYS